jgi:hypothetical protein
MRGKKSSAAAKRRADNADALVLELQEQITELRASMRSETVAKNAEIAQLQGRLASDVDKLSSAAILAVEQRCQEEIQAIQERYRRNALKALDILKENNADTVPLEVWSKLSELFGLKPGDLFGRVGNRGTRRLNKNDLNRAIDKSSEKLAMMDGLSRR